MPVNTKIRNIAIIAHVDHGKTTLVDGLLKQSNTFRANSEEMQKELILDSNELERERGITILAKNTAIIYKGVKINIIDTPGHADFAGEVERTLHMADGCLLVIDAQEGPMPQTKFVLKKALQIGLRPIVVINKIDKKAARPKEVLEETYNLFLEQVKHEDQLNFPIFYSAGRAGKAWAELPQGNIDETPGNFEPIFEAILKYIPAPEDKSNEPLQMLVASLDWDNFKGKYLIGRIVRGKAIRGASVVLISKDGKTRNAKIDRVFTSLGLGRVEVEEAASGDIVALTGLGDAKIGETIADAATPEALPGIEVEEPTIKMALGVNTSPFAGREGQFVTSRQLKERIEKELETNVGLRLEYGQNSEFIISGRGELHLSILIETMRREGYEFKVGKPEVILKNIDGISHEPYEEVSIDIPEGYVGIITEELGRRKGELKDMRPEDGKVRFVYEITTRGLFGLRNALLTGTRGTAVINSVILGFKPVGDKLPKFRNGVLIADRAGEAVTYGLNVAQGRGATFIEHGTEVYEGMIIGENSRIEDIDINVCKEKKLTNMRSSTADMAIQLAPPVSMSLEQWLGFIEEDEYLEVTPKSLRLFKKYLSKTERSKHKKD